MTNPLFLPADHCHAGLAVCTKKPKSRAWFEARRMGITATDISALTGYNRYKTPLDVWLSKTAGVTGEAGEAAKWGTDLEPNIVRAYRREHKPVRVWRPQHFGSVLARQGAPLIMASLDALGEAPAAESPLSDATEVVEVKTAGARVADRWEYGATPTEYVQQVQWQLAVTGLTRGRIVVLIGGQDYQERVIAADPEWQGAAMELATAWWAKHVIGGVMPDIDPHADADHLPTLWQAEPDLEAELDPDMWAAYVTARAEHKAAEVAYKEAAATVKTVMGRADTATVAGEPVARWTPVRGRRSLDQAALKRAQPDLYDKYMRIGKPGRTFRLSTTKKKEQKS